MKLPNNISPTSVFDHSSEGGEGSPQKEGCPQDGVVLTTIGEVKIFRNFVHNLPHNPKLKLLAREKRKAGILPEVLFWKQVHKKKFYAIDFDRQRIIGNYIVDFYVKALGLVVEIDGSSHDHKQEYDAKRQLYLETLGLKVFRLSNEVEKKNIGMGMQALADYIVENFGTPKQQ